MNKYIKKLLVLAMTAAMVLSMGVAAYAAEGGTETKIATATESPSGLTTNGTGGTPANSEVQADTTSIKLVKKYDIGTGSANDGTAKSPTEDFVFTITPIKAWNVGKKIPEGTLIPALGTNSDGVSVNSSTNVTKVTISHTAATESKTYEPVLSLDKYPTTGDYWYKVEEHDNKTTGVTYATNAAEADGTSTLTYYIHVQVVNGVEKHLRSVTLHKNGPVNEDGTAVADYDTWLKSTYDEYKAGDHKVCDIDNDYKAGSLSITKKVTGNAGDTHRTYEVVVTFTKAAGTVIRSDIAVKIGETAQDSIKAQNVADTQWKKSGETLTAGNSDVSELTCELKYQLKDDETLKFDNIPFGVTYTVTETDPDDGHINQIKFTDKGANSKDGNDKVSSELKDDDFGKYAEGKIDDDLDSITIENYKNIPIDVGVILENAPYVAILLIAAAAVVVFARRRKVSEEY